MVLLKRHKKKATFAGSLSMVFIAGLLYFIISAIAIARSFVIVCTLSNATLLAIEKHANMNSKQPINKLCFFISAPLKIVG